MATPAALAARGGRLAALHLGHVDWRGADVLAGANAWSHLAALGAHLATLTLDIPGAWYPLAAGEEGLRPLPLSGLLAAVAAAAPALERLALTAALPATAEAARPAGTGALAAIDGGRSADDAAAGPRPAPARRGAPVAEQVAVPALGRLQALRLALVTGGARAAVAVDARAAPALRRVGVCLWAPSHRHACRSADGHDPALVWGRSRLSPLLPLLTSAQGPG